MGNVGVLSGLTKKLSQCPPLLKLKKKKKIKKIKSHGKYLTIYYVFGYRLFC